MRSVARDLAILALVGGIVLFTNLGGPRLWDRDEPRNAGCAVEMMERGDWITPWFNDELRTHKPVLLYWLILTAYSVFGVSEFSARFWSAALGVGAVWLTYALGRRLFNPQVGLWAGVILCTTLMFDVAARAATPDSVLLFCVTLALTAFVYGEFPKRGVENSGVGRDWNVRLRLSTAVLMYGAMGLAVLAKGPVGAVLPTAVVGMFLLVARKRSFAPHGNGDAHSVGSIEDDLRAVATQGLGATLRLWAVQLRDCGWGLLRLFAPGHFLRTCRDMRPLIAVGMILAVAGPWYVWVGVRTEGEFLGGFFWQHNLARAVQSFEGHRGGPWFYPVAICIGFFPWSVFASPLLVDLRRRWNRLGQEDLAAITFALCWACVWVGIFSIARTKLPSYVTPAYPALALLTAEFVRRWSLGASTIGQRLSNVPFLVLGGTGMVLVGALPFVARRFLPGAEWLACIGLIPLAGAATAWFYYRKSNPQSASLAFGSAAVAFTTVMFGVAPQVVDRYQRAGELLAAIQQYDIDPEVGALGGLEPSWVFYGGRPIREVLLDAPPASSAQVSPFAPKPFMSVSEFLEGDSRRVVIAHGRQLPELRKRYGERLAVLAEAPKFLKNDHLYVVTLHGPRSAREKKDETNLK